jgi:hypothetical protein
MSATLHTLVLVQLCGWAIFGLLMVHIGWDGDIEHSARGWPWSGITFAFFWSLILVAAVFVIAADYALGLYERFERRSRR